MPISFKSTQWESLLYNDPKYKNLPAKDNPNVIESGTGKIQKTDLAFWSKGAVVQRWKGVDIAG